MSPTSRSSQATLRFQEYLRARGLIADLVIINEQAASYVAGSAAGDRVAVRELAAARHASWDRASTSSPSAAT